MQNSTHSEQLIQAIYRFLSYVKEKDGEKGVISFQNENSFLGKEENYKTEIAVNAQLALKYGEWTEEWIANGKILDCVRKAMDCAKNLVYSNQKVAFKNKINPDRPEYRAEAARVLYHVFKSTEEAEEAIAFQEAKTVFGGNYDTIAYLFFIKDCSRFLPISSGHFERSLATVGFDYPLGGKCSWDNYKGYLDIVETVKETMQQILPSIEVRLIDAHSFLWVTRPWDGKRDKNGKEKKTDYQLWTPAKETAAEIEAASEQWFEGEISGNAQRKTRLSTYISRNAEVAKITKERAKGICQLCGQPAPFNDKNGNPYLETHHVVWLSKGGMDSTDNTVALCPNCHTKMHVVDDEQDVNKLKTIINRL